jgi:hypothetical protein
MASKIFTLVAAAMLPLVAAAAPEDGDERSQRDDANDQLQISAGDERRSYTWDELVELIPDIRQMQVVYPKQKGRRRNKDDAALAEAAQQPKLCRLEQQSAIGSRIKRRKCYTLDEYVAQYIAHQQRYRDLVQGNRTDGFIDGTSVWSEMSAFSPPAGAYGDY